MRRSFPDSRRRGLLKVLPGLCALSCLAPGFAASALTANIQVSATTVHSNFNDGTQLLEQNVELRQAPDTLLRADKAQGNNLIKGYDDGHWVLTGKVHIEFNSSVLDADSATVMFVAGRIRSIEVQGKPALFSQPAKIAGQRNRGRADTITYDASTRQVRFNGHPWYSFGPYEGTADTPMLYNLDSTELSSEKSANDNSRIKFTFRNIQASAGSWRANINGGTQLLQQDVELRQAPDTLIRADKAEGSHLTEGYDNSHWTLTGKVHIDFNAAMLDADSAAVVLADRRLQSIEVNGTPARFSNPAATSGERDQGRAQTITYDAATRRVRFTGHSWYSSGPYETTTDKALIYDLDSGSLFNEDPNDKSRINFTFKPQKRVPAPGTPQRSTAK